MVSGVLVNRVDFVEPRGKETRDSTDQIVGKTITNNERRPRRGVNQTLTCIIRLFLDPSTSFLGFSIKDRYHTV